MSKLTYVRYAEMGNRQAVKTTYYENKIGLAEFVKAAKSGPVVVLEPSDYAGVDDLKEQIRKSHLLGMKVMFGKSTGEVEKFSASRAKVAALVKFADLSSEGTKEAAKAASRVSAETSEAIDFVRWKFERMNKCPDGVSLFGGTTSIYPPEMDTYEDADDVKVEASLEDEKIFWKNKCSATEFYREREDEFDACIARIGEAEEEVKKSELEEWTKKKTDEIKKQLTETYEIEPAEWFSFDELGKVERERDEALSNLRDGLAVAEGTGKIVETCKTRLGAVKKFVDDRYFFRNAKIIKKEDKEEKERERKEAEERLKKEDFDAQVEKLIADLDYDAADQIKDYREAMNLSLKDPDSLLNSWIENIYKVIEQVQKEDNPQFFWFERCEHFLLAKNRTAMEEYWEAAVHDYVKGKITELRIVQATASFFTPGGGFSHELFFKYYEIADRQIDLFKAGAKIAAVVYLKCKENSKAQFPKPEEFSVLKATLKRIESSDLVRYPSINNGVQLCIEKFRRSNKVSVEILNQIGLKNIYIFIKEAEEAEEEFTSTKEIMDSYLEKMSSDILSAMEILSKYMVPDNLVKDMQNVYDGIMRKIKPLQIEYTKILSLEALTIPSVRRFFSKLYRDIVQSAHPDVIPERTNMSDLDQKAFNEGNPAIDPSILQQINENIAKSNALIDAESGGLRISEESKNQIAENDFVIGYIASAQNNLDIPRDYIFTLLPNTEPLYMTGFSVRAKIDAYLGRLKTTLSELNKQLKNKGMVARASRIGGGAREFLALQAAPMPGSDQSDPSGPSFQSSGEDYSEENLIEQTHLHSQGESDLVKEKPAEEEEAEKEEEKKEDQGEEEKEAEEDQQGKEENEKEEEEEEEENEEKKKIPPAEEEKKTEEDRRATEKNEKEEAPTNGVREYQQQAPEHLQTSPEEKNVDDLFEELFSEPLKEDSPDSSDTAVAANPEPEPEEIKEDSPVLPDVTKNQPTDDEFW